MCETMRVQIVELNYMAFASFFRYSAVTLKELLKGTDVVFACFETWSPNNLEFLVLLLLPLEIWDCRCVPLHPVRFCVYVKSVNNNRMSELGWL